MVHWPVSDAGAPLLSHFGLSLSDVFTGLNPRHATANGLYYRLVFNKLHMIIAMTFVSDPISNVQYMFDTWMIYGYSMGKSDKTS